MDRVRLGDVWDSTTQVLSGRGGMLAGIAGLSIVLPGALRDAAALALVRPGLPTAGIAAWGALLGLLSLVVLALTVVGQLAITAAATDPAVHRGQAFALALRRLPAAIGLYFLLLAAVILLVLPIVIAIVSSGVGFTPGAAQPFDATALGGGTAAFIGFYAIAFFVLLVWLSARLFLLNPVIVGERAGTRAFARSFALTRGMTWRIIGFVLLAGIILLVALLAAQLVSGLLFRLVLGADRLLLVAFLSGVVGQIATAAYVVVVATFAAQFYVAVSGRADDARLARTFE